MTPYPPFTKRINKTWKLVHKNAHEHNAADKTRQDKTIALLSGISGSGAPKRL